MPTATYVPLATQTLGSAAASITFSSIPGTYTDLRLVLTCTMSAGDVVIVQFNGDTATNYSETYMGGDSTATVRFANRTSVAQIQLNNLTAGSTTVPMAFTAEMFSYAGSTNKTLLGQASLDLNGSGSIEEVIGLWRSTSAITSVVLKLIGGNNFSIGTTATLWGI